MEFTDLNDLKMAFMQGKFKLEDEIHVGGFRFRYKINSPEYNMHELIVEQFKGVAMYQSHDKDREGVLEAGLNKLILMVWSGTSRNRVVPYDVRTISEARAGGRNLKEADLQKYEKPDNIIGSVVEVKVTSLPGSGPIKGKVDTGATICSLHADNYKINREANTITFVSPELSRNELTVPLVDQQSVKSADGGSEYRPVIELNIKVNGKIVNNVKFNLNDRSHMEFPMLVGKNALGDGKFLIDPRMDEDIQVDWDAVQEWLKEDDDPIETTAEFMREVEFAIANFNEHVNEQDT